MKSQWNGALHDALLLMDDNLMALPKRVERERAVGETASSSLHSCLQVATLTQPHFDFVAYIEFKNGQVKGE